MQKKIARRAQPKKKASRRPGTKRVKAKSKLPDKIPRDTMRKTIAHAIARTAGGKPAAARKKRAFPKLSGALDATTVEKVLAAADGFKRSMKRESARPTRDGRVPQGVVRYRRKVEEVVGASDEEQHTTAPAVGTKAQSIITDDEQMRRELATKLSQRTPRRR